MASPVTVLAAVDADPEQVRLEAIRSAAQEGANLVGDPTVQTTGTITANSQTITLDESGLALYTWQTMRMYTSFDNVSPVLLAPRVL